MEVDHEAMKRDAAAKSEPAHDPAASAPEMVDMSHKSGAVPDQYESYPEVVTPQQTGSQYPPSSVSAVSPAQTPSPYDRYQTISPPPAQSHQPLMQNVPQQSYFQGPIPVESEQKGYYGPSLGVSQPPTPYSNAATIAGQNPSPMGSSHEKTGGLPPPSGYPNQPAEKKILGMRKKIFWIVLVVVILVIAGAGGGAAGAIISNNNKNKNQNNPNPPNPSNTNNPTGYTPFALTTGVRTLDLTYSSNTGSCNTPSQIGTSNARNLVDCHQTSRYQVSISGSVESGYTLSSVNVQNNSFDNVRGTPPTTDDPTADGGAWVFDVIFTQQGEGLCSADRGTRYAFGNEDSIYAVGEVFSITEDCALENGGEFKSGTSCTCIALSTTHS